MIDWESVAYRRRALCLSMWCALVLAACGKQNKVETVPPPPKPPTEPLAWLPSDANVVGRVELAPFRQSSLWPMLDELQPGEHSFSSFIDIDLIDEVTLGGKLEGQKDEPQGDAPPDPKKPSFVSVIRGRFGDTYLANVALKQQLAPQQKGLLTIYARKQESWAQLAPDLLLVFSPDREAQVVERAGQGDGVAVRSTALYQALASKIAFDSADLVVIAEDTTGMGRDALRKQSARVGIAPLADDVTRAGLSVDLGNDVAVVAVAETPDNAQAEQLKKRVTDTLTALSRNLIVGVLGLRPVVGALETSSEQNFVTVRGSIPQADLEPALRKLSTMLQMASAVSGQSQEP
jgi:hypothetical protein